MNKRAGQIQLILGPMFSGKTSELIRRIKRYETANHKCMVVKYAKDVRYDGDDESGVHSITTHDKNRLNATVRATVLQDVEEFASAYTVIGVDEGQFFKDVVEFSEKMANLGKIVIVAALDGTYQRKAFGDILHLVPLAESVIKLNAVCMNCFNDAPFTKRKTSELKVELIGGKESYLAVCRECYHDESLKRQENVASNEKPYNLKNKENLIMSPKKILSLKN